MSKKLTSRRKKEEKKLEPWEEDLLEFDKIWGNFIKRIWWITKKI